MVWYLIGDVHDVNYLYINTVFFESVDNEIRLKPTPLQSKAQCALFLFPGGSCVSLAFFLVGAFPVK